MSTALTPSLAPTYTCKFCRRTFSLNGPVIIGEKPEDRIGRLSQKLWDHLGTEHKNETAQVLLAGQQFSGWLMFSQFENNDAELLKQGEQLRLMFRQTTKRVHVSDEEIEQQVGHIIRPHGLGDGPLDKNETRKTVIALLKALRNTLEEIQPQKP